MKNNRFFSRISASLLATLLISMSVFFLVSCKKDNDGEQTRGKTYILVHGAFQAAYSWNQVKAALEAKGNRVVAIELPGHGEDMTAPENITLNDYRDKVVAAIKAEQGNVVLVGHSMGGMVISAVAEIVPEKISRLVYLAAFVPQNGGSLAILAMDDKESQLTPLLDPITSPGKVAITDLSRITAVFCADATETIKQELLSKYRPDPFSPFRDPVLLTTQRFGSVAKSYIRTTSDVALGPKTQDKMIKDAGITDIYSIASSHCPHLSRPAELTDLLIAISK